MALPVVSGRDALRAILKLGFGCRPGKGSHVVVYKPGVPPQQAFVIPQHKELKRGTLRHIINQAGITTEKFLELLRDP